MSSRTAAAFPQGRYSRPAPLDETSRIVTFTDEDGGSWNFDFTDLAGPASLIDDLIEAVIAGSSLVDGGAPGRRSSRGEHGPATRSVLDRRVSRGGFGR